MSMLIILALVAATAFPAEFDLSKVRPRDLKRDTLPGVRFPSHGRITGGQEAGLNQFPYQVFMTLDNAYFCGGSVIAGNWILTAAHCVDGFSFADVTFGTHTTSQSPYLRVRVPQSNITIHGSWNPDTLSNDIALLGLPESISFDEKIQPVLLPRITDIIRTYETANVIASGWGKTADSIPTPVSLTLQYVESTVQSLQSCRNIYGNVITTSHICMNTTGGKSTCNGDSGGPLVTTDEQGRPVLIGATSFGASAGCELGYPAVFTRIVSYLSWINQKTGIQLRL